MRWLPGLLSVAVLVAACASNHSVPTAPDGGTAAQLPGTWVEENPVVGSALVLTLATHGSAVTGHGTYAIEAGRSGSVTVSGGVNGTSIHLDLAYDSGNQAQFDGSLSDVNTLQGAMHFGPPSSLTPSFLASFRRR